jgi:DNA-binding transcriptional regulator YbjK
MRAARPTAPPDARRREILAAVLRLIARAGVDGVRYREVAVEAGAPLGTVQYHFASREALLRAAFAHFLDENTRGLLALRRRFDARRLEDVADYLVATIRADFADPESPVLAEYELILYAARDPEVAAALERWERAMAGELAPALEELGAREPTALARTLIEIVRGFQLVHLGRRRSGAGADLRDLRRRLRDVLRAAAARPT